MIKPTQVTTNSITLEQISKCTKVYDYRTRTNYYLVENESGKLDENNDIIEYKVTFSKAMGFQCTCEAGQRGFVNCKHVAWAVAAALEARAQVAPTTPRWDTPSNTELAGPKWLLTGLAYEKRDIHGRTTVYR